MSNKQSPTPTEERFAKLKERVDLSDADTKSTTVSTGMPEGWKVYRLEFRETPEGEKLGEFDVEAGDPLDAVFFGVEGFRPAPEDSAVVHAYAVPDKH